MSCSSLRSPQSELGSTAFLWCPFLFASPVLFPRPYDVYLYYILAMASYLAAMASNLLLAMASYLVAMASNLLLAMAFYLVAMASNLLLAMASYIVAMASNLYVQILSLYIYIHLTGLHMPILIKPQRTRSRSTVQTLALACR